MIDIRAVTGQPNERAGTRRRMEGAPIGRRGLEELWENKRSFYYQLSQPDLGKGHRTLIAVCKSDEDFEFILQQLSRCISVWAEPMSQEPRQGPQYVPKPWIERDYSHLPGEPTNDPETVKAVFKQGYFKYQFGNANTTRSRVMRCTDEPELAFILRQLGKGASIYIELIDKPSA